MASSAVNLTTEFALKDSADHPGVGQKREQRRSAAALAGAGVAAIGGCTLLVGPQLAVAPLPTTSAFGFSEISLPLPMGSSLFGASIFGQAAVLDPGGSALGTVALTNGLRLTFGD